MNTVSITDLRQDATKIIGGLELSGEPTYILQNSKARAVIVDVEYYEALQEALEDLMDVMESQEAMKEPGRITMEEYARKRWGEKYAALHYRQGSKRPRSAAK